VKCDGINGLEVGIGNDRDSKDWNFGQNYLEWTLTKKTRTSSGKRGGGKWTKWALVRGMETESEREGAFW